MIRFQANMSNLIPVNMFRLIKGVQEDKLRFMQP